MMTHDEHNSTGVPRNDVCGDLKNSGTKGEFPAIRIFHGYALEIPMRRAFVEKRISFGAFVTDMESLWFHESVIHVYGKKETQRIGVSQRLSTTQ